MRYILTKDNTLYDLESKKVSSVEYLHTEEQLKEYGLEEPCYSVYYYSEDEGQHLERDGKGGHSMDCIYQSEIVKQSDVIEEIFDDIIINEKDLRGHIIANCLREQREYRKEFKRQDIPLDKEGLFIHNRWGNPVYGGIWTDKGFKYLAKMNKQGEFEIIEED